jgi:riboflavin kinase / FMN adenylyltransferase
MASDLIKIYTDEHCRPDTNGPAAVTVGTFDGVHRGHQEILKALSATPDLVRTVVTFEPHPQSVIRRGGDVIPLLTTIEEKRRFLCHYDVDRVFIMQFDQALAQLSAEQFMQDILLKKLQAVRLVIGYNHSFGRGREGNIEYLQANKDRFGYDMEVVGPFYLNGAIISSTKIRHALAAGDVETAGRSLGRPYELSGKVVTGIGRGHEIGFPTANLEPNHPDKLIPAIAVYAVAVELKGQTYPGMLGIGTRPTFGGGARTIEVHLIGFSDDLYGQTIGLHFLKKLRNEERYPGIEALQEQMGRDRENSLAVYQSWQAGELGF